MLGFHMRTFGLFLPLALVLLTGCASSSGEATVAPGTRAIAHGSNVYLTIELPIDQDELEKESEEQRARKERHPDETLR